MRFVNNYRNFQKAHQLPFRLIFFFPQFFQENSFRKYGIKKRKLCYIRVNIIIFILLKRNYLNLFFTFFCFNSSRELAMQEGIQTAIQVPVTVSRIANQLWPTLKELSTVCNINCKSDLQVIPICIWIHWHLFYYFL